MKKFHWLLIFLLCGSAVLLFGGCKKQPEQKAAAPISLDGYAVVRPQLTSEEVLDRTSDLYEQLCRKTGTDVELSTDFLAAGSTADPSAKEILIGHTNRPETETVLSQLQPGEYAVAVVGNKLVITGFTEGFTPMAVSHFLSAYLGDSYSGTIPGDLFARESSDCVTLVERGNPVYTLVRAQYASDTAVSCLYGVADQIESLSGAVLPVQTDRTAHNAEAFEIFVGQTDYPEVDVLKESCAPDTYGVYYVDHKIILFGWTDEDLMLAVNQFKNGLKYASYQHDDGTVSICYPCENRVSQNAAGYDTDIPMSAGGIYYNGVFNSGDQTMLLYWKDAGEELFDAYTAELTEAGFTVWQSNRSNSVRAATYRRQDTLVHVYYLKHLSELHVVSQDAAVFPINAEAYEKLCDVSVTQLGLDYSTNPENVGGMGYVILLEDGTFAVIDGGYSGKDSETLWETLNRLKPMEQDDIVISAWFLTHGHHDHYGVLRNFLNLYSDRVTVKYLIGNDPSDYLYSQSDQEQRGFRFDSVNGKFGGCRYLKAHTGQSFSLPGVTFHVLFTQEDSCLTGPYEKLNSLSMVFDAVTNDTRYIWLGDIEREAAKQIKAMYYEDLKCDVMQVAHHGVNGGSEELYRLCNPSVIFYPAAESLYRDYANLVQNKYLLENCEKILFAYEGTQTISYSQIPDFGDLEGGGGAEDDPYSKFY